ncbi:hypothetical protein [Pseudomonas syringae]|uniref:hypothetical protein n=1 Tax=Pseudomonas syringae TaxID=317 RepID=UPI003204F405
MSNDKMREEFEAACTKHAIEAGYPEHDHGFDRHSEDRNCYSDTHTQAAWWAWQASREALVIELPDQYKYADPGEAVHAISDCRAAIEAAGVKVKS